MLKGFFHTLSKFSGPWKGLKTVDFDGAGNPRGAFRARASLPLREIYHFIDNFKPGRFAPVLFSEAVRPFTPAAQSG